MSYLNPDSEDAPIEQPTLQIQQVLHHVAVDIREAEIAPGIAIGQFRVIDAQVV